MIKAWPNVGEDIFKCAITFLPIYVDLAPPLPKDMAVGEEEVTCLGEGMRRGTTGMGKTLFAEGAPDDEAGRWQECP